jgi:hypothetical protein
VGLNLQDKSECFPPSFTYLEPEGWMLE